MFSPTEKKVLKVLGRRKMSISDIVHAVYADYPRPPLGSNNRIGNVIRRISAKCQYYELKWFLDGKGMGRNGRTVWRSKV